MGFWHLMLIGGLITWTACVFLRAVAARTCQLRLQLVPLPDEEEEQPGDTELAGPAAADSPSVAAVIGKPKQARSGEARAPGGGNGKPAGKGQLPANGNGHAKVPVRRPGR